MDIAQGILLAAVGLGMLTFWTLHILSGKLDHGFKTLGNGGFILFHIGIEIFTGLLCLAGGTAMATMQRWGDAVALFASGMLLYTGINSLAWSEVRANPNNALMFIAPALIAIISGIYLIGKML